jgi:hypothetical protein
MGTRVAHDSDGSVVCLAGVASARLMDVPRRPRPGQARNDLAQSRGCFATGSLRAVRLASRAQRAAGRLWSTPQLLQNARLPAPSAVPLAALADATRTDLSQGRHAKLS